MEGVQIIGPDHLPKYDVPQHINRSRTKSPLELSISAEQAIKRVNQALTRSNGPEAIRRSKMDATIGHRVNCVCEACFEWRFIWGRV